MSQKYEKLKTLLKELFQLDQPDLDFGLYRIMHAKAAEVTQFLDKDLLPQVKEAFSLYKTADKAELQKELAKAVEAAQGLGVDPESTQKVKDLRAKIASEAVDLAGLENEVYDHLYSFFRRYYSEGDFLAKRVYKPGVYAIPYEGEEVKLHWANRDQYYIKTSEYLRDYAFRLRPDHEQDPMRVHFRLVDAAEGEHGNVKAAEGKDRVFILAAGGESGREFIVEEDGEQGKELSIRFEYRPATLNDWPEAARVGKTKPPAQKELTALAVQRVLVLPSPSGRGAGGEGSSLDQWLVELAKPHVKADGERADYCRLEAHLRRYTARNTFDYFIHKDLGGFLRRELDFYVKNELMHLDDVENESAPRVEQYLSKIKVICRVAGKLIEFLTQLEDFQKKLWLKKKFVTETQYCVTLDRIPDFLYPQIAENDRQSDEWARLFAIDEIKEDMISPGYSKPLTVEFLKANPALVLDTVHFSREFKDDLLQSVARVDATTCGLLVQADSFHAINLLTRRYAGRVACIYIDPPYNTGNDEFIYRDSYPHSSWLAMIENRLAPAANLLTDEGVVWVSIDDNEQHRLTLTLSSVFGEQNWVANVVWQKVFSPKNTAQHFSDDHEYVVVWAKNKAAWRPTLLPRSSEAEARYTNPDNDSRGPWSSSDLTARNYYSEGEYEVESPSGKKFRPTLGTYWRVNSAKFREFDQDNRIWWGDSGDNMPRLKRFLSEVKQGVVPQTLWFYEDVGHTQDAKRELLSIVRFERTADVLNTVKPTGLIRRAVHVGTQTNTEAVVMDFFAGSGTTGHAVLKHNAEDGGNRKFILVEMSGYFDQMTRQRVCRALHSPEWKDGKPATNKRGSGLIKYIRLESYEDALNNVEIRRSPAQRSLLDTAEATGVDKLREQYILRYMLDVETRGSQSLLNVQAFTDPTAYKLKVKRPGSDESREVNVDLLETFNWLIGLTVQHIAAPLTFTASFERDSEKRLRLKGRLKSVQCSVFSVQQEANGAASPKTESPKTENLYWFRTVTGTTPDGRKTLIIWRKRPGGETPDGIEQDNLVLDEWFTKQGYSSKDSEFDLIYVNGSNNLENLKAPDDTWKVRLIEEDFHRLMFETEDV